MNKKAFICSYDAVITLMFIIIFLLFITYYTNTFSYSTMENYEITRNMDAALKIAITNGEIADAVQKLENGQANLAENNLRSELKKLFGSRHNEKITIKVYNPSMSLVYSIQSAYPTTATLSKDEKAITVRHLFNSGDYYGIAELQLWK